MKLRNVLGLVSLVLLSCDSDSTFPETCKAIQDAEVEQTGERPVNGSYTLYVGGDEAKPWTAYCHNMTRADPTEYLTVTESSNYSEVTTVMTSAQTSFRRYRIDPVKLEIDLLDDEFASTDGDEMLVPDGRDHIPAGWAQYATSSINSMDRAEAKIDLQGSEFAFADSVSTNDFFCTVENGGANLSTIDIASNLVSVELTALNNSMIYLTKTVADCDQLGGEDTSEDEEFENAKLPLQYRVQ